MARDRPLTLMSPRSPGRAGGMRAAPDAPRLALGLLGLAGGLLGAAALARHLRRRPPKPSARPGVQGAEQRFLRRMVAHHEIGVALARLAAEKADQARLRALGRRMYTGQTRELDLMRRWFRDRYGGEVPALLPHEARTMAGMPPWSEVGRLERLSGRRFETAYLQVMIAHHKGAIRMSEMVRRAGAHPRIRALARSIEHTRRNQVADMERQLAIARPVEEEGVHIQVTERLQVARGRTPRRTLTGRLLDASRRIPVLLSLSQNDPRRDEDLARHPTPPPGPHRGARRPPQIAARIARTLPFARRPWARGGGKRPPA